MKLTKVRGAAIKQVSGVVFTDCEEPSVDHHQPRLEMKARGHAFVCLLYASFCILLLFPL